VIIGAAGHRNLCIRKYLKRRTVATNRSVKNEKPPDRRTFFQFSFFVSHAAADFFGIGRRSLNPDTKMCWTDDGFG